VAVNSVLSFFMHLWLEVHSQQFQKFMANYKGQRVQLNA